MRLIAGRFKSRPLVAPKGLAARPTADRVRESLFNWIEHGLQIDLDGGRVIDLFAGSGALGFEALSRGAAFALFVETGAAARGAIRDNIEALGLYGATRLHRRDATLLGAKPAGLGPPFDLAFLDPPYRKGLAGPALAALAKGGWLAPGAHALVETAAEEAPPAPPGYAALAARSCGPARITAYRLSDISAVT